MRMFYFLPYRTFTFGTGPPIPITPTYLFIITAVTIVCLMILVTICALIACYMAYRYKRVGRLIGSENPTYTRLTTNIDPHNVYPDPPDPQEPDFSRPGLINETM